MWNSLKNLKINSKFLVGVCKKPRNQKNRFKLTNPLQKFRFGFSFHFIKTKNFSFSFGVPHKYTETEPKYIKY